MHGAHKLTRIRPHTMPLSVVEAVQATSAPQDAQTDALVSELRAQLAEMRSQRDAWQGIAERLALAAPKVEAEKPVMGWWCWLWA
jgi:hypothetical protein